MIERVFDNVWYGEPASCGGVCTNVGRRRVFIPNLPVVHPYAALTEFAQRQVDFTVVAAAVTPDLKDAGAIARGACPGDETQSGN